MTKLLVLSEDSQVIAAVTQLTGCEIVLLRDTDEGINEAGESNLALLDMTFSPIRDAAAVIRQYTGRDIPVILIGEVHHQTRLVEYLAHGADDYVLKPVHPALLQKRIQQVLQAGQHDRLVGFYAHEIKNPLVPVVGWIDMVRQEIEALDLKAVDQNILKELIPDWLMIVRSNAVRIEYLINDLRDMSKLVAGRQLYLDVEAVDLAPIITGVVENEKNRLRDRELILALTLPESLPPVTGDSHYLPRLFWNLVTGAIKASEPETTITITVSKAEEFVHITVQDEGVGRSESDIDQISPRGYDSNTGLRLSRAIVQQHGGEFRVTNNADKGITVHFTLPIANIAYHEVD